MCTCVCVFVYVCVCVCVGYRASLLQQPWDIQVKHAEMKRVWVCEKEKHSRLARLYLRTEILHDVLSCSIDPNGSRGQG